MELLRRRLAVLAFLLSVLAGKMLLPIGLLGIEGEALWAELRFTALAASALLFWSDYRIFDIRALLNPVLATMTILCLYLFGRSWFDVFPGTALKRPDYILMILQAIVATVAVQTPQTRKIMAFSILGLASAYLLVAIGGQLFDVMGRATNYGLGWGPVGGPITFNRIQLLAASVAMCLAIGSPGRRIFFAALAALFFFATIASLQKAAIAAAGVSVVFVGALMIATGQLRRALPLIIIVAVGAAGFVYLYGDRLSGRLTNLTIASPGTPVQTDETGPFYVTEFGVLIQYCSSPRNDLQVISEIPCRTLRYADRTARLTFTAEAIIGFLESPLWGKGIAGFLTTVVHPDTLLPDIYKYPHNLILEVAYESGGVGIALVLAALVVTFVAPFRSAAPLQVRTYVGLFMVFLFINTMFAGDLYDSRMLWIAGIFLAAWPKHRKQPGTDQT